MALGFLYTCTCGKRFKAYVPKHRMFCTITGDTVDWERIDQRDEDEGQVEEVRRQAQLTHSSFVDVRGNERLTCPDCEREIDLISHFRGVMTGLTFPRRDVAGRALAAG